MAKRNMNVLSLFSGIGGLELGLERAGMTVVGQVELDELCRSILARHWPEVPRHDDVRTAVDWWRAAKRPPVRVVCGGFPCQPFSLPGLRKGTADERWGWPWMGAVIRAVRPEFVIVENVAALLTDSDAFGWMLGDLATLGFDAEWSVVSACSVGAPHMRDRLFVVAYPDRRYGKSGMGDWPAQRLTGPRRRASESVGGSAAARVWRDRVSGALATARADDRETNGLARRLVTAGGNAVVPQVAEYIGRLVMAVA